MSYYNIAVDEVGKVPPTIAAGTRPMKAADRRKRSELDDLETKLDAGQGRARRRSTCEISDAGPRPARAATRRKLADGRGDAEAAHRRLRPLRQAGRPDALEAAATRFRALPIIDGFASPTKIKQIWLPDLTIDYGGFKDVPRYDRCTTCHLGIDRATSTARPWPGSATIVRPLA